MSIWKNIAGVGQKDMVEARKALHQAIQIVGAVPRNLLFHDPTDGTASLEWNDELNGLQALPIANEAYKKIIVGFIFGDFSLYISDGSAQISSLDMNNKSVDEGFEWLKQEMSKLKFDTSRLTLDLPYSIENYDYSKPLSANKKALVEYSILFANTQYILSDIVATHEKAFDIRCWPHHFDIATLIPLETDKESEILKSIGVGLSPGDEGIEEPYVYVNVWPHVAFDVLSKHSLSTGHWNKEGWSGAVLTYSELLKLSNQREEYINFTDVVITTLL